VKKQTAEEERELAALPAEISERIERVLARAFRGIHHCEGWSRRRPWGPLGLEVIHYHGLATFDYDELTRLVIAAHDECVRVHLIGAANRYIRIGLTVRQREGDFADRHDTIEAAIEKARKSLFR
jgi:hypothetical protein